VGLVAGRLAAAESTGRKLGPPPAETAHGALVRHITGGADAQTFQPMNINFGLFPALAAKVRKNERKRAMAERALAALAGWGGRPTLLGAVESAAE
jgi:methylenetetrahydrofolate--tRNA-(uracil-5-)-methyltransferase